MLVIDKPAGIAVHAGPGGGPHLEHWFPLLRFGLPRPPALAHRLDRDTSGCLILGRHPKALRRLGALFAEGKIEKVYWAVAQGAPVELQGTIDAPLRKDTSRRTGWRMEIDPAGQRAVTEYRVLGSTHGRSWLELRPKTGRTHQILRALRGARLPDRWRPDLRRPHEREAATSCPRYLDPALSRAPGHRDYRAGAAAYARGADRAGL